MPLFNWPYTNLHNLNLDWIIKKIKNVETAESNTAASEEAAAGSAASAAESEANAAESETNAAASATAAGNYYNNIRENVSTLVTGWMDEHITPTTPPVDDTLTIQGAAADAKKTGDEITDLKNAIQTLADIQKLPVFAKSAISGTNVKVFNGLSIPAGTYRLKVSSVVSSDTQYENSRITFYNGSTLVLATDVNRVNGDDRDITLSSDCDIINFYGAHTYSDGTGVTFTYNDVQILKNTALNERLNDIEDSIDDINTSIENINVANTVHTNTENAIYDTQMREFYSDTVSGTTFKEISLSLPAGNYIFKTDSIITSDTDSYYNTVTFYNDSTLVLTTTFSRSDAPASKEITLSSAINRILFYASSNYSTSTGDTFAFSNLKIKQNTRLNERITALENKKSGFNNPYSNVLLGSDFKVKTTTHDHCTVQTVLDNLMSKNLNALAISNYYPSRPAYPLSDFPAFTNIPDVIQIPNAEQHGFTNTAGACHLNSVGSMFTSGKPLGQTPIGVNDTWEHAIIKINRDMLFEDGGGITINHPVWSQLTVQNICDFLDYSDTVLGIEIYNQSSEIDNGTGWALDLWDEVLKTGRRCYGFAVPDHKAESETTGTEWYGSIRLIVPEITQQECLKAIRNGAFYSQIKWTSLAVTDITANGRDVSITVNESATIKAISDGAVISTVTGTTMNVSVPNSATYVRFEIETANDAIYTNAIMY